jgi:hypothetical protein
MTDPTIQALLVKDSEDDYILVRDLLSERCASGSTLHWVSGYDAVLDAVLSGDYVALPLKLKGSSLSDSSMRG